MSARKPPIGTRVTVPVLDAVENAVADTKAPSIISMNVQYKLNNDLLTQLIYAAVKQGIAEFARQTLPYAAPAPAGPFIRLKQYEGHYVFLQKPRAGVDAKTYNGSVNGEYVVIEQTPRSLRCIRPWISSNGYSEQSVVLALSGWDRVDIVEDVEDWEGLQELTRLYYDAVPTKKEDSESDYGFKSRADKFSTTANRLQAILDAHAAGVTPVTYPPFKAEEESNNPPF